MVLGFDSTTDEAIICSAWGPNADWVRNLRVRPALRVEIGSESFVPQHRLLTDDEAFAAGIEFRRKHPVKPAGLRRSRVRGRCAVRK